MNYCTPIKRFVLFVCFTAAVAVASAQNISDSTVVSTFYAAIFNVNRTEIQSNDSTVILDSLLQVLRSAGDDAYIVGRAAASPEGPYWNNVRLANGRRMAMNSILARHGIDTTAINYQTVVEDYELLAEMLRQAKDPNYAVVQAAINVSRGDLKQIKELLMLLDDGAKWKHWHEVYFPALRATRIWTIQKTRPINLDFQVTPQPIAKLESSIAQPQLQQEAPSSDDKPRREFLSIKTNLLGYGFFLKQYGYCPIPNIELEYYPKHGHWTGAISLDNPWWVGNTTSHKYMQVRNWQIEGRYYLRNSNQSYTTHEAAFKGLYLQAYANTAIYGIGWSDKRGFGGPNAKGGHGWQGEGGGAGAGIGYVLPLSRHQHWRIEFSAQFGFFRTKYDPYIYGCPVEKQNDGLYYYEWYNDADDFKERQYRFSWIGPTKVGIHISYDLLYRRNKKRGVSFKAKEGDGL